MVVSFKAGAHDISDNRADHLFVLLAVFFLLLSISYHKKDDNIEECFRKGRKKRRRPVNVCAVEGFILF